MAHTNVLHHPPQVNTTSNKINGTLSVSDATTINSTLSVGGHANITSSVFIRGTDVSSNAPTSGITLQR